MSNSRPISVLNLYRKQLFILISVFSAGAVAMLLVAAQGLMPYYIDDLAQQASQALRPIESELVSMLLQQDYSAAHQIVDGPRFTAPGKIRELRLFALDEYARTGLQNTCTGRVDPRSWGLVCHEGAAIRIELPIKSADNTLAHIIVSVAPSIWTWKPFVLLTCGLGILLIFGACVAVALLAIFKRRVAEPMEEKVRRLAAAKDLDELNTLIKDVAVQEHRQLADVIVDRQEALQVVTHELALMAEKERLFREASQLVHDVKTPIASAAAQADQLSVATEAKDALRGSLGRIRDLLEGYLIKVKPHTRAPQTPTAALAEDIDHPCLGILLSTLRDSYAEYACQRGVRISLDMPRKAWVTALSCNESKIERALTNLLSNAIDAAVDSNERSVKILASISIRGVEICICDSGRGFPTQLLADLMAGKGCTTKPQGTGMGFIGARNAILGSGGELKVTRGAVTTVLTITLPTSSGETWLYDPAVENPAAILSIDDDPLFHMILKRNLDQTSITTMNRPPGIPELQDVKFDRIFVDYDLGQNETGLEVITNAAIRDRACLVSGMISLDRKLYRQLRIQKIRSIPKEYFYA